MAKKKKNHHIMYQRNWHPKSYSEQARELVARYVANIGKVFDEKICTYEEEMYRMIHCSVRGGLTKIRMIKGLRRYGKRKGLI